jgi:putative addiction module component (TIGR02574 family)
MASQVLVRVLDLSTGDRGALIARLIDSLDDAPVEAGAEEAWAAEIKRRVDDLRSGKARLIPEEEVRRRAAARLRDGDVSRIESTILRGLRLRRPMNGTANAATTRGRHLF